MAIHPCVASYLSLHLPATGTVSIHGPSMDEHMHCLPHPPLSIYATGVMLIHGPSLYRHLACIPLSDSNSTDNSKPLA